MGDIGVFGDLILDIGVFGTALLASMDEQRHFFRQTELGSGDLVGITVEIGGGSRVSWHVNLSDLAVSVLHCFSTGVRAYP